MPSIGSHRLSGGGVAAAAGAVAGRVSAFTGQTRLRPPKCRRPRLSDGVCFRFPFGVNGSRAVAVARLSAGRPRRPGPGVSRARLPVVSSIALPALRASGLGAAERPGFSGRRGSVLSPAGVGSNPELVSPVPHRTGHVGRGVAGGKKCRGGREIKKGWLLLGARRVPGKDRGGGSRVAEGNGSPVLPLCALRPVCTVSRPGRPLPRGLPAFFFSPPISYFHRCRPPGSFSDYDLRSDETTR